MTAPTYVQPDPLAPSAHPQAGIGALSGVSWAAIFAGALAAAALSLILFILGIGLGLSSVSVWSGQGAEGETMGWTAIAWLAFAQLASAGVGGYLAGRLRVRWQGVQTDEVYFRDTAHGFLSWSLATLLMAALMGSVAGNAITGTVKAAGSMAAGATTAAAGGAAMMGAAGANANQDDSASPMGYWVDSLFRQDAGTPAAAAPATDTASDTAAVAAPQARRSNANASQEVMRIYAQALQNGKLSEEDARHVAYLISERTGMPAAQAQERVQKSFAQAQQRVEQAKDQAKQAAETARKAVARTSLWMFVALLMGAFFASLSATWGGRQRDAF